MRERLEQMLAARERAMRAVDALIEKRRKAADRWERRLNRIRRN